MDTLDAIFTRRSVRNFKNKSLKPETIHTILEAGMAAPSCANTKDWCFVTVEDKEILDKMADANGRPAQLLHNCPFAVLLCGDLSRSFSPAKEYWIIDVAIAGAQMQLAAHSMGLGCVWLGTWPQQDRVKNQSEIFDLPKDIIPHSILAFGYPEETPRPHKDIFDETRVHTNGW